MKNLLIFLLLLTSCVTQKHTDNGLTPISVKVILPGDTTELTNYESDTSHYNVYNVTYKKTGITQLFVLGQTLTVADMVSMYDVEKIDTLQTKVLLIDVNK